ncbi:hypothetical protein GOBAR_AA08849 [Gossypium barbadense]|uniref:Uncharacterized protein n=1 Tax=Gossypium barbadense TaxID=3634 RepID=A0A2P5Y8A2_GOSBA|nr:hypothetical protein GOBAR_AA08849 [Gossypium barbadense]
MRPQRNGKFVSKIGKLDSPHGQSPLHLLWRSGTSIGLFRHNDWNWTSRDDLTVGSSDPHHILDKRRKKTDIKSAEDIAGMLDVHKDSSCEEPARGAHVSLAGMKSREESSRRPHRDKVVSYVRGGDHEP